MIMVNNKDKPLENSIYQCNHINPRYCIAYHIDSKILKKTPISRLFLKLGNGGWSEVCMTPKGEN